MNEITFRQLRYFDALAGHSHIGRAAAACGISQPALSMQIKELEEAPGAVLIERGARRVRLTKFGEDAALRVRDILRSVDELGDFARASRGWLAGQLHIGMIPTIAPYLLPTVIGDLARMHPELDIHVREALTSRLIQELVEGRLDTAIVALPVSEPSLTEVALFAGSGPVVLQYAILAAARDAGRELSIYTCPNGQRRHGCNLDPGNGRGGGDTLGVRVCRSLQGSATLANHWHDLAQDESPGRTALAAF